MLGLIFLGSATGEMETKTLI